MEIQQLTAHMNSFVRSQGWYEQTSNRPQIPRNLAISLTLEAAEILELFQWNEDFKREELQSELADVALYLFQLASVAEIDLEQAVLNKLAVNHQRKWEQDA